MKKEEDFLEKAKGNQGEQSNLEYIARADEITGKAEEQMAVIMKQLEENDRRLKKAQAQEQIDNKSLSKDKQEKLEQNKKQLDSALMDFESFKNALNEFDTSGQLEDGNVIGNRVGMS